MKEVFDLESNLDSFRTASRAWYVSTICLLIYNLEFNLINLILYRLLPLLRIFERMAIFYLIFLGSCSICNGAKLLNFVTEADEQVANSFKGNGINDYYYYTYRFAFLFDDIDDTIES